jgi:putative tryptophan/tyrosine transport system substrate-binding protein
MMRRRDFITLLGGAAAAGPIAARAQQAPGLPRVIYFPNNFPDDPETQARHKVFREGLERLGWNDGRNVRVDEQWGGLPVARMRSVAAEFVRSAPAVVVVSGSGMAEALKLESRAVPVVFVAATDPAASGLVDSMERPGANVTGFANYEFSIGGKWLAMLKEAAPAIRRVLVIAQPGNLGQLGLLRGTQAAAPAVSVQLVPAMVDSPGEVEHAIDEFATQPNGGLIGLPGPPSSNHSDLIIALAARHRLPALYTHRFSTPAGGLMSYDTDIIDLWRRAAGYVGRILKGEKPGNLPVQLPTKYDLVINLKTAKALGLDMPNTLLAIADEVIE